MPELIETTIQALIVSEGVRSIRAKAEALRIGGLRPSADLDDDVVRTILFDALEDEQGSKKGSERLKGGFVDDLPPGDASYKRGATGKCAGTSIWPPSSVLPCTNGDIPCREDIHQLVLVDFHLIDGRYYVFEFQDQWFIVHPRTHCLPQLYNKEQFFKGIYDVPKTGRDFKIPLAFVLGQYVLAITSMDNLIGIEWQRKTSTLGILNGKWDMKPTAAKLDTHVYITDNFNEWLQLLVKEIKDLRHAAKENSMSVFQWIHENEKLFPAIGLYSTSEHLHKAGIMGALSLLQMLGCASEIARICASYMELLLELPDRIERIRKLIKLDDYVVTASKSDREAYTTELVVFGKLVVHKLPDRYVELLKSVNVATKAEKHEMVFDVYEPSFNKRVLDLAMQAGSPYAILGPLIFGQFRWHQMTKPTEPFCWAFNNDPLTTYLKGEGLLEGPQYETLLPRYDSLYPPEGTRRVKTHLYQIGSAGRHWSVLPLPLTRAIDFDELSEDAREKDSFRNFILHFNRQKVGPIDFAGAAIRRKSQGGKKDVILMCNEDPRVPLIYRNHRALAKAKNKSSSVKKAVKRKIQNDTSHANEDKENEQDSSCAVKRRCADLQLLDANQASATLNLGRTRGSTRKVGA